MLNLLIQSTRNLVVFTVITMCSVLPLSAEEVSISHEKLTLNANLNLAKNKSFKDGIMLLLHGTLAHKDMEIMTSLQKILLERNISNLAINLSLAQNNRHGMYDCATPHNHLDSNAETEIALWVNWLKKQGADRITLLGHSRGGNQIARYVANTPSTAITGTVLVSPPTKMPEDLAKSYLKSYQKSLAPYLEKAKALVASGAGDSLMKHIDFIYCPDATVSALSFVDYNTYTPKRDTPTVVKKITLPLLVVVGTKDTTVPHLAKAMAKIKQNNVTFVEVEGADHFFLDFYAEDLVDAIEAFLNN